MLKGDEEGINHEKEMANSLSEQKLALKWARKARKKISPCSGKIRNQISNARGSLSSLNGASFKWDTPLPKSDDAEAWGEEFDSHSNLEFSPLFDEDLGESMKKLTLRPRRAKALQENGSHSAIPPWPRGGQFALFSAISAK